MKRWWCYALWAMVPGAAWAQQAPVRPAPRPRPAQTAPAAPAAAPIPTEPPAGWDLGNADVLRARISEAARRPDGARAISALLYHGVEPTVAAAGLDALAAMARPESAEVILRFLDHRRAQLRRRALIAAARIHTPALLRAIDARLGDADASVRGEAARTLADVADARSITTLFTALDQDLSVSLEPEGSALTRGATLAIGSRGAGPDLERLVGYLRRAPFPAMAEAFHAALARNDLPDAVKLRVVRAVIDVATPEAQAFLNRVVEENHQRALPWIEAARVGAARIQ